MRKIRWGEREREREKKAMGRERKITTLARKFFPRTFIYMKNV
jgi:hypothetical protein